MLCASSTATCHRSWSLPLPLAPPPGPDCWPTCVAIAACDQLATCRSVSAQKGTCSCNRTPNARATVRSPGAAQQRPPFPDDRACRTSPRISPTYTRRPPPTRQPLLSDPRPPPQLDQQVVGIIHYVCADGHLRGIRTLLTRTRTYTQLRYRAAARRSRSPSPLGRRLVGLSVRATYFKIRLRAVQSSLRSSVAAKRPATRTTL